MTMILLSLLLSHPKLSVAQLDASLATNSPNVINPLPNISHVFAPTPDVIPIDHRATTLTVQF